MAEKKQMKVSKKKVARLVVILALIVAIVAGVAIGTRTSSTGGADPALLKAQSYAQVQSGDESTQSDYVQFDAYFLQDLDGDGYAEGVRGTCKDLSETANLYMEINVLTNGHLEGGKITIHGDNMKLSTSIVSDSVIDGNYISDNTTSISLKDINNGTQRLMFGTVKPSISNIYSYSSNQNYIELTGTHVADNGTRTSIDKKVYFICDWYGNVKTSFYNTSQTFTTLSSVVNEDTGLITLTFSVYPQETLNELLLAGSYIYGTIPAFNGYMPTSVTITGTNVTYTYDEETGEFTAQREAVVSDSGSITSNAYDTTTTSGSTTYRRNSYTFTVVYPIEAFTESGINTISLTIPVYGYYTGYNNPDETLGGSPTTSNIAQTEYTLLWSYPSGTVANCYVYIGKYRTYNGTSNYVLSKGEAIKKYEDEDAETDDTYLTWWYATAGNTQVIDGWVLTENNTSSSRVVDYFYDGSYYTTDTISWNTGIYFSNASSVLGSDGYIYVSDADSDELLVTFTSDGRDDTENWSSYSSSSPYYYGKDVRRIKVETTAVNQSTGFYVYHVKKFDDDVLVKTYSREQFDAFTRVYTYLDGDIKINGVTSDIAEKYNYAIYEEPISTATISISPSTYGTQETTEGASIKITTSSNYYNMVGWENGEFLIELPAGFLACDVNSVSCSDSSVTILAYEVIDNDGQLYIKISTENDSEATYTITIDCDITPDPRYTSTNESLKLYAYNEYCDNYYKSTTDIYDVDGDGSTSDKCAYDTASVSIIAPATLLTNQIASNYDDEDSIAVAPQIAVVDKAEADTVTIEGSVTNNYGSTVSEVLIVGQLQYEENEFVLNGTDLNSDFTVALTGPITVTGLDEDVYTIYYSVVKNPTNDLDDSDNCWMTEEELKDAGYEWSDVTSYLIDLGDYVVPVDATFSWSYTVSVPSTVQYNDISYSTHAIYFCLDTSDGKFKTQTETSKLGISIERKYNIELTKYKHDTDVVVQGARFSITADGEAESKIAVTDSNGKLSLTDLYVDKVYKLKEIKTPSAYETNSLEVKFIIEVDDTTDELVVTFYDNSENELKSYSLTQPLDGSRGVLNLEVENIPKYIVTLNKVDSETGDTIKGVKYELTGGNFSGSTYTTSSSGQITISGLSEGVEYTLQEISANGYYVNVDPIVFSIEENNGEYTYNDISGSFTENVPTVSIGTGVSGTDAEDKVEITVTNEAIPTFSLQLVKYELDSENLLANAQYRVTGDGISDKGETYTTDENGVLTIPGLYLYEDVDGYECTYTITEVTSPTGYTLNEGEITVRVSWNASSKTLDYEVSDNGSGMIRILEDESEDITVTDIDEDNETGTLVIGVVDKPLFELIKTDEDGAIVEGAKFVIYQIDDDLNIVDFAKDINGNYVGELVDGDYISTTDENGKISYGLQSGLYKVVEVETLDEYVLEVDEKDRTWYFGIDANKEEEREYGVVYNYGISGEEINKVNSTTATSDGGVLAVGYFEDSVDIDGDSSGDIYGTNSTEGFLAKYDVDGNLVFSTTITGKKETSITDVIETTSGIAVCGYFESEKLYINGADSGLEGTGSRDAMILTFDSSGNFQRGQVLTGSLREEFNTIIQLSNGNYVVGGIFSSTEVETDSETLNITATQGKNTGLIVCYSSILGYEWSNSFDAEGTYANVVALVASNSSSDFVVVGNTFGTLTYGDGSGSSTLTGSSSSYSYGFIIKYDNDGEAEAAKIIGTGNYNYRATDVICLPDGRYVVTGAHYGAFTIDSASIVTGSSYSGMMLMFDTDLTCTFGNTLIGSSSNYPNMITTLDYMEDDDGEYILIGGYTYETMYFDEAQTQSMSISGMSDVFIAQYAIKESSFDYTEWYRKITSSSEEEVTSVSVLDGGEIVVGGWFSGSSLDVDQDFSETNITLSNYEDGFIAEYGEVITSPEIAQLDEIEIENKYKRYVITTEIAENSEGQRTGGTVTGEYNSEYPESKYKEFVENVKHGDDAENSIVITPDDGYVITKITLDGEEIAFVADEDGVVTLPALDEVTSDHHYVVTFEKDMSQVIVYHILVDDDGNIVYDESTGSVVLVADTETLTGKVGADYTSAPKFGLEKYDIAKNSEVATDLQVNPTGKDNDDYYIPGNSYGVYIVDETIYVYYYYVEKQIPLTVHHWIEGTEENVPSVYEDPTEYDSGKENESYSTNPLTDEELDEKYELSEEYYPENAEGIYEGDSVDVYYYYKLVERDFELDKLDEDGNTIEGIKFTIKDSDGNEIEYTTNAGGTISDTLEYGTYTIQEVETVDGYILDETIYTISITKAGITLVSEEVDGTSTEINTLLETKKYTVEVEVGEEETEEYEIDTGVYVLDIVNNFKLGKVIVYHYIYDSSQSNPYTDTPVPSKNGGTVDSIEYEDRIGADYMTYISNEVAEGYVFVETTGDATSGKFIDGTLYVYYYYNGTQKFGISKVDEYGNPLEGVVFEILDSDNNLVGTYTTDENGKFSVYLNFGEYTVKEVSTIYGYDLNTEEYKIIVDGNGVAVEK